MEANTYAPEDRRVINDAIFSGQFDMEIIRRATDDLWRRCRKHHELINGSLPWDIGALKRVAEILAQRDLFDSANSLLKLAEELAESYEGELP